MEPHSAAVGAPITGRKSFLAAEPASRGRQPNELRLRALALGSGITMIHKITAVMCNYYQSSQISCCWWVRNV